MRGELCGAKEDLIRILCTSLAIKVSVCDFCSIFCGTALGLSLRGSILRNGVAEVFAGG